MNRNYVIAKFCLPLFVLLGMIACGDSDESTTKTLPPEMQAVEDELSKSYSEHFQDVQGDYSAARRITGRIQTVVDKHHRMSTPHVMGLIERAGALERETDEGNYLSLVGEWDRVKSKIKLENR